MKRATVLMLIAVALMAAVRPPFALADGDPASDYLVGNQVFLTAQSSAESPSGRQLLSLVRAANRARFSIRVAVISSEYDLGGVTALWRKPRIYARFLGLELSAAYKQRLLVVMPNGFGFNWPGHQTEPEYRVLAKIPIGAGAGGVAAAADTAVRRLAAAGGVAVPTSSRTATTAGRSHAGSSVAIIAAAAAALVAMLALGIAGWRRRPRVSVALKSSSALWGAIPRGLRWAISALVALCAITVAVTVVALNGRSAGAATPIGSVVTPPPFAWPAGRRSAPDFVLRDQMGRPVSLSKFRGRSVVVTFVDPLCRNLCPLEAKVLNDVVARMPAAQRPEIVAVSVDVYANARANLLQDVRNWALVPEWHWGVGLPAQLAAVWKRYSIGVSVTTKRIAGTTIHYILHTEAAYIVDPSGHERALFLWPFYPQDVERTLRRLA
jgi:cytochrome oxidase Cu insertion factor (SCO1/SenC/PrrC family)